MNLEEAVSDLQIEVKVLQKLVGIMMDSVADARLATKTADKALEMAQEALVVVASAQSSGTDDPMVAGKWSHEKMTGASIGIVSPNRGPSDMELSKALNESDNMLEDENESN